MDIWPSKDPDDVDARFIVWCDPTGLNDGSASDDGELQGATISTATWTVPTGITKVSSAQSAITIHGVTYAINTICTIWLSGGTHNEEYTLGCRITTSDGRTLDKSVILRVKTQ